MYRLSTAVLLHSIANSTDLHFEVFFLFLFRIRFRTFVTRQSPIVPCFLEKEFLVLTKEAENLRVLIIPKMLWLTGKLRFFISLLEFFLFFLFLPEFLVG
jgi:hypothetical protein